jgi:hypothetical protein
MPVALAAIKDFLFPGLREITGKYRAIDPQWPKIFKKYTSDMALERTAEARFLGLAALKSEGAATTFDNNAGERYVYNVEHNEIGLGYAITRKAIDDNLYKSQFKPSNLGLFESFSQTKEIYGAAVFNTGNVYNPAVVGDGQPFFSTAHPTDAGPYANTPSIPVDLNESTLLSAMISIRRNFIDQAGLKFHARAMKLLIPPELEPIAIRLLQADLRPGSADNDPNAIRGTTGGLKEGYTVNDYLTSPYPWFLLTNIDGLAFMERVAFETDMSVDFVTDNLLVKGYERYSFSTFNPRSGYGSFPTS